MAERTWDLSWALQWRHLAWEEAAQVIFSWGREWLQPGMVVLEVGCGEGRLACWMAREFGVRVMGVEVRQELVDRGRVWARQLGVEDLVEFSLISKEETLSLRGSYDALVVRSVLYHICEEDVYREWLHWMKGMLVPGGAVIALENGQGGWVTRWSRRFLLGVDYHGYCLMNRNRLDDFFQEFGCVKHQFFGRLSPFFSCWRPLWRLAVWLEMRCFPATVDRHFVAALLAVKVDD